ncbi:S-layer homology domain-containing protein [Paenibacillus alkaliterrae]|uniref:S-layer homology domain-containing protein n=1 Tax=Paenibacillus alkaliterrae TaxID=320909 RepID=UPI001F40D5C2|nr:S-layer homology domain-containing protein [Paenibacillus alkaliterrae]MCF2939256.1 S-layer homology domain-containing protein [Paenibacillus alkaliterrae]
MKRGKKAFVFLFTVCLMALSCALPAAAAEVPKENYTISVTEELGEVTETLTLDDFGDIYEDLEVLSTLVPENATLTFSANTAINVVVSGYYQEDGILIADGIPWTIKGQPELVNGLQAETTATVTFSHGYPYYELYVWDEASGDSTSYFFKVKEGTAPAEQPDAWAQSEVDEAIAAGLISQELQGKYKEKITRADFSKLIIKLVEVKAGMTIDEILAENEMSLEDNPFTDTAVKEVIAANKLGIVNGKGNGKFDPNGSITRQEAAIMLTNTAEVLGFDISAETSAFADNKSIAAWAKTGVDFVSAFGIMNGTGNNTFTPKGTYTRQQAYMTISRLNNALVE